MSIHDGSLERLEQLLGVYATDPDVDMDAATVEMIERLTAENGQLRDALRVIAVHALQAPGVDVGGEK